MQFFYFVGLSILIKIHGISGQLSLMMSILKFDVSRYGKPCIFKVDYLRNYCSYLLYICTGEGMQTRLSGNEIKFKNFQKVRE